MFGLFDLFCSIKLVLRSAGVFVVGLLDLRLRLGGIENWTSRVGLVGLFDLRLKFRLSGVEKFGLVGLVDRRLLDHVKLMSVGDNTSTLFSLMVTGLTCLCLEGKTTFSLFVSSIGLEFCIDTDVLWSELLRSSLTLSSFELSILCFLVRLIFFR